MQWFQIRILDLVLSTLGIIVTLPFMLVIAALGFFINRSPIFFQTRVGQQQKLFTLVKFRTMKLQTEPVGTHLIDANSITRFGIFLRKSKLDELPQLFNVLLGQMSLVGHRPCLPNQTELTAEREKRGVFNVRPGITGLAQVSQVDMSTPRKLSRYDQIMINRMHPMLYVIILVATVYISHQSLVTGKTPRVLPMSHEQFN